MYRFARSIALLAMLCGLAGSVTPASAQSLGVFPEAASLLAAAALDRPAPPFQTIVAPRAPAKPDLAAAGPRRPRALVPLYVSYAGLQLLDTHSTTRAVRRGAEEGNPLMRGVAGHPAGMLAVKAAGTAGVIYAGEKLWRRNKAAAVVFMVAANSAMAWVVQHNYRAVR